MFRKDNEIKDFELMNKMRNSYGINFFCLLVCEDFGSPLQIK